MQRFELANKETKQKRLIFCEDCIDFNGYSCGNFGVKTDRTCGCLIKAKIQFKNQKCPKKKW